jgi:hypothetical protein
MIGKFFRQEKTMPDILDKFLLKEDTRTIEKIIGLEVGVILNRIKPKLEWECLVL